MVQLYRSDSELVAVGLLLVFFDFPYATGGENLVPPPAIILRSDSANDWGQVEYTLDAATYFSITQWTKLVRRQYRAPCPHPTVIYSIRNAGKVSPSSAAGSLAPQKTPCQFCILDRPIPSRSKLLGERPNTRV